MLSQITVHVTRTVCARLDPLEKDDIRTIFSLSCVCLASNTDLDQCAKTIKLERGVVGNVCQNFELRIILESLRLLF